MLLVQAPQTSKQCLYKDFNSCRFPFLLKYCSVFLNTLNYSLYVLWSIDYCIEMLPCHQQGSFFKILCIPTYAFKHSFGQGFHLKWSDWICCPVSRKHSAGLNLKTTTMFYISFVLNSLRTLLLWLWNWQFAVDHPQWVDANAIIKLIFIMY